MVSNDGRAVFQLCIMNGHASSLRFVHIATNREHLGNLLYFLKTREGIELKILIT